MNQSAGKLLLVRPSHFSFNQQTASSNFFQKKGTESNIASKALDEFDAFARRLSSENILTFVFDDHPSKIIPDAVFPNNWISFHHNGTIILYPMAAANRRAERRKDIIEFFTESKKLQVSKIVDLSHHENENKFLEGTGSLVFDHLNKQVYMSRSHRSNQELLSEIENHLEYQPIVFDTKDADGNAIYHTNVMMSIGNDFAVICPDFIADRKSRVKIIASLDATGRKIIELTPLQVLSFAGNIIEVINKHETPYILISETALASLNKNQIQALEKCGILLPVSIPTIQYHGGGSVRCMVAEVFLPERKTDLQFVVRKPNHEKELKDGFDLRWKILRKPWNQPKGTETDDDESTAVHYLAFNAQNKVIGTARLQKISAYTGQIRYMAVDQNYEGIGVGKMMLAEIEKEALKMGLKNIFLQAREPAIPFYRSAGYTITEKTYLLFDSIQHYAMTKELK